MFSKISRISSSLRNEVSQSIWVNSGWRSARRSSSRKRGDLVVAVEARHHQHLLEQLRRLRQREEVAGVHARGQGSRARLRACSWSASGFDVDEAQLVRNALRSTRGSGISCAASAGGAGPARGASGVVSDRFVIELERRRDDAFRISTSLQALRSRRGQFGVGRAGRTLAHQAGDADAEFVAQALGGGEAALSGSEHDPGPRDRAGRVKTRRGRGGGSQPNRVTVWPRWSRQTWPV